MSKKGSIDVLHLITGVLLILAGLLYVFNNGSWGLIIASIGLLIEAVRKVI